MKFHGLIIYLLFSFLQQGGAEDSLWSDNNPYSGEKNIKAGSIISIIFKDNVKTEFKVEVQTTDNNTTKTTPDKKLVPELIPYSSDKSFVKNNKGTYKTIGNLSGKFAVVVNRVDEETGTYYISGRKETLYDGESQTLQVTGIISSVAVKNMTVNSADIANLRVEFKGKISPKILKEPNINLKQKPNPDGTTTVKAELSEEEKQQMILNYIKRLLGESE